MSDPDATARRLEETARRLELPLLGWTGVEQYEAEFPGADLGPSYLPGVRSVVVFGAAMLNGVVDSLLLPPPRFISDFWATAGPGELWPALRYPANLVKQLIKSKTTSYTSRYHFAEHLEHLNTRVDRAAYAMGRDLEGLGHRALPVDPCKRHYFPLTGAWSLKHAAAIAGLGRLGEHRQLMVPGMGVRIWLGGLLTTAELPERPGRPVEDPCPGCGECVEACPFARRAGGFTFPTHACTACSMCLAVCPGLR